MSLSGAASKSRSKPGLSARVASLVLLSAGVCGAGGLLTGLTTGLTGCAHACPRLSSAPLNTTTATGAQAWVETQLFFGLGPAGSPEQGISDERWRRFLDAEVTPRFPSGLTVVDAYGQWQGAGEASVERLRSKVIVLVHRDTEADDDKIDAVRAAWKKLTGDQSVLRVSRPAQVSF